MTDPRVRKLAQVLVHYSLHLQAGEQFLIQTSPLAEELNLAVYEEALKAGAHPMIQASTPGANELFYQYASDAQLDYVSPVQRLVIEQFQALLSIGAISNTRALSGADPEKMSRSQRAGAELNKIFMERAASGDLKWCYTVFPTQASAQEADMSLRDYQEFVYGAGQMDLPDPVQAWLAESERQKTLIGWLAGKDQVVLKGANIDLSMSIQGRKFMEAAGHENFPDGEIYTSPVEDSANGWVRFAYPAIFGGREVTDIELWFENGRVVKEKAGKGQDLLVSLLNSDDHARILGELGIGTNYKIQRFTKNMLFDEKLGGTIHLAVGAGFPEAGGKNASGLHWDMLCDMSDAEIRVDGELFYQNSHPVI